MTLLATALFLAQTPAVCPVAWTGSSSQVTTPQSALIEAEQDWFNLWLKHTGQDAKTWPLPNPVPEVDFKSYNILAIFGGKVNQTAGYTVLSVDKTGDSVTFRFFPRVYSVGGGRRMSKDAFMNTPYGFFLIPKDYRRVKLEEGIIESKTLPPTKFKTFGEVAAKGS